MTERLRAPTEFSFTTPKPSQHYHAELKTGSWYSSGAGYISLMKNSMRIRFKVRIDSLQKISSATYFGKNYPFASTWLRVV